MNSSHSNSYLKEAVFAILKGHISIKDASEKYSIPIETLNLAIKNYGLYGKIDTNSKVNFLFEKIKNIFSINLFFKTIAPTYTYEKEIDRFKFKLVYTLTTFLIILVGIFTFNFFDIINPFSSNAKLRFEDKVSQVILNAQNEKISEAELKYLNNFYSRINKILSESKSSDSLPLKEEVEKRLQYIRSLSKQKMVNLKQNKNFEEKENNISAAQRIYSNLYNAATIKNSDNYLAKSLKERLDSNYLKSNENLKTNTTPISSNNVKKLFTIKAKNTNDNIDVKNIDDTKYEVISPTEENIKPQNKGLEQKKVNKEVIKPNNEKTNKNTNLKSNKSAQNFKLKSSYDNLSDKLYIASKYNINNSLKTLVKKQELKFKYPITSLFIIDKEKYNESIKRIIANNSRKIEEDKS